MASPSSGPPRPAPRPDPCDVIYLDHNASSPLCEAARDAMAPWQRRGANPASLHAAGRAARAAVEGARAEVAALMGLPDPAHVVFTGGGTEADVMALRGVFEAAGEAPRDGLVVSAVEHPAVMETARRLEAQGARLAIAPVDHAGRLGPLPVDERSLLVSIMAANNETGVCFDVAAAAATAHRQGALFHCDAVQAAGRIPLDVARWEVDLCSVSAHKIGGPQGVGALFVRPGTSVAPLITGGGQEDGRRSGTVNVAGVVGFGAAARAARAALEERARHMEALRDALEGPVLAALEGARVLGAEAPRLPNTSAFVFRGVKGEAVVMELDAHGIAASTGSACSSTSSEPSHVLVAMGVGGDWIDGAVRLSLGPHSTRDEVDEAGTRLVAAVRRLRELAAPRALDG